MSRSPSESGNIFFLILGGIAIFAALSWAFTQNSRQSAGGLSSEQSRLAAQEIIAYGNQIADTVQKLKLRGCTNNQFNFANTAWTQVNGTPTHNTGHNPTTVAGCAVFSASDGKLSPITFPLSYTNGVMPGATNTMLGHGRIVELRMPGIGDAAKPEMAFQIPRLSSDVCMKINDILGIQNPGMQPPNTTVTALANYSYDGSFDDGGSWDIVTDTSGLITGKTVWCAMTGSSTFAPAFTQILIAR